MYGKSTGSYFASILMLTEIFLVFMPIIIIAFCYIDDFIYKFREGTFNIYLALVMIIWYLYGWYYFSYRGNAKRIIEKYDKLADNRKKRLRRFAGRLTLYCYLILAIQLLISPLYVNWSFKKLGKKAWYEQVNYYDNTKK